MEASPTPAKTIDINEITDQFLLKYREQLQPVPEVAPEVIEIAAPAADTDNVIPLAKGHEIRKAKTERRPDSLRHKIAGGIAVASMAIGGIFGAGKAVFGATEVAAATPQEQAMAERGWLPSDGSISETYDNPDTPAVEETIADREIIFFAEQAPEGSNYFGPEGESSSPEDALTNMLARAMADPTLLAGNMEMAKMTESMTPEQRDELVRYYINNPEAFDAAHEQYKNYLTQNGAKISFSTFEGKEVHYYTQYQKTRKAEGLPPMIYQSKESMQGKLVLRVDLPASPANSKGSAGPRTLYYKIDCGYQPVSPEEFENVPELPPEDKPEKPTTTTSTTTTTEKPEESTTTTSTVPESTTTTTTIPETTTTTSTVPEETTTTTSTTSTTTTTVKPTTTTTTVPPKHDPGKTPGEYDEPGEPDKPGEGGAGQEPGKDGYLPGEKPVTPPTAPPTTIPTTTTTVRPPATTSPAPSSTKPPVTVTTVTPTTRPETQMPEMP